MSKVARVNLSILAGALALAAFGANAAEITRTYHGTVSSVWGTHEGVIKVGDPITVSYTLDNSVGDVFWNDPSLGLYIYSVRSLSIGLPAIGFTASGQTGTSQARLGGTEPGAVDDVQVYTYRGGITSGALEGSPVVQAVVEFLDDNVTDPRMITTDAMPTGQLVGHSQRYAQLHTDDGFTGLTFTAEPTAAELVADGTITLQGLVASGAIKSGVGTALTGKLNDILAAYTAGDTAGACLALKGFTDQVRNMPAKQITAAARSELLALAESLRVAIGGC